MQTTNIHVGDKATIAASETEELAFLTISTDPSIYGGITVIAEKKMKEAFYEIARIFNEANGTEGN